MEIKFRAKLLHDHPTRNLKKGDWVFGFYLEDLQDAEWKSFIFCDCTRYEVDKNTLGQFTGFLDGDNKPIYEHDIVSRIHSYIHWRGEFKPKKIRNAYNVEVEQGNNSWERSITYFRNYRVERGRKNHYITRNGSDQHPLANSYYLCRVVGDYFSNPELLKVADGNA